MLDLQSAIAIVKEHLPEGDIYGVVEHDNLFVFLVTIPDPDEGDSDPFYSVNRETSEFSDFAIFANDKTKEVLTKFQNQS